MSVANRVHERDEDVKSRLQGGGELSQAFDYPGLLLGNDAGNPRYQNDGEDGHYESNDDVWHWGGPFRALRPAREAAALPLVQPHNAGHEPAAFLLRFARSR